MTPDRITVWIDAQSGYAAQVNLYAHSMSKASILYELYLIIR